MRQLLVYSAVVHLLFYFKNPLKATEGFGLKVVLSLADMLVRLLSSIGNTFLLVYVTEAFPTVIRHYELGFITFVSRLAYMLQPKLSAFWRSREIHPFMVNGLLYIPALLLLAKLRETREEPLKDFIEEDEEGFITGSLSVGLF
jgi:hypothetical protein